MVTFYIFNAYIEPNDAPSGATVTAYMVIYAYGTGFVNARISSTPTGIIYDNCLQSGGSCQELGQGQYWSLHATFTMPSSAFTLNFFTSTWNGSAWVTDDVRSIPITPGVATCSSASISRDKSSVGVGETVTFTLWRSPAASGIVGELMRCPSSTCSSYTQVGTCTTDSNGTCYITWTPTSADIGSVYFRSEFPGCYSANTYVTVGSAGDIVVTSISVSPNPVISGNTVTITASLKNDGDLSASEYVYLKSDGTNIDSQYKTIAANSTGSATWTKTAGTSQGFAVGTRNICAITSGDEKCTSLTVTGGTQKWKCSGSPNYTCSQAADGIYDTQSQCQAACVATTQKWKCTNTATRTCSQGSDSTYTFPSKSECQQSASCQPTVCQDPLNLGCTYGIPNTYIVGGIGILLMMKK